MDRTFWVDGKEYHFCDNNITSEEIALAGFGGYVAFTATITAEIAKEYGDVVLRLAGKRISNIASIIDAGVNLFFDYNGNPNLLHLDYLIFYQQKGR